MQVLRVRRSDADRADWYLPASVLLLGFLATLGPAFAAESHVFGPVQFDRLIPQRPVTATFQNCEPADLYQISLANGDPNGSRRVSSASIVLNGEPIVKPQDLSQTVGHLIRPVSLKADNELRVEIGSAPEAHLSMTVSCVSNCLGLQIATPQAGSSVAGSKVNVSGTIASSSDEVGVAVNGRAGQVNR